MKSKAQKQAEAKAKERATAEQAAGKHNPQVQPKVAVPAVAPSDRNLGVDADMDAKAATGVGTSVGGPPATGGALNLQEIVETPVKDETNQANEIATLKEENARLSDRLAKVERDQVFNTNKQATGKYPKDIANMPTVDEVNKME